MEKRLVVAIALSLLVMVVWSRWVNKTQPIVNQSVTSENLAVPPQAAAVPQPVIEAESEPAPETLSQYQGDQYGLTLVDPQAGIKEVTFNTYLAHKFSLVRGFALSGDNLQFKRAAASPDHLVFVHTDSEKRITKEFIFNKSNYDIWLEIKCQNLSPRTLTLDLPLTLGVWDASGPQQLGQFKDFTIATKEKLWHSTNRKDAAIEDVLFLGLRDRYFCAIIEPQDIDKQSAFIKKINKHVSEIGLMLTNLTVAPQQEVKRKFHIYLGPQDIKLINAVNPKWSGIIYYGTFDVISQVLLQILRFFYGLVHNWGWAIVLLSLLVYLVFYPLTLKQMRSMKEMQALQPHIEELRKAHKDNPQKLNKEIMELYREHKVNPFAGCLPLLLQMPIFFALYQALMRSVVLKGASFLWIKDLSEPDRLFVLGKALPILGTDINILPILMTIGMFFQQKLSMAASSGPSAEQQKIMLIMFPLMFGVIFYRMPSGLVLYWFINSMLMLWYQFRIKYHKEKTS